MVIGAVVLVVVLFIVLLVAHQPVAALVLALSAVTIAWAIARERQDSDTQ